MHQAGSWGGEEWEGRAGRGPRGDWVGELMGDSRKKRRSLPPLVLGSQRTRAGGGGGHSVGGIQEVPLGAGSLAQTPSPL